MSRLVEIEYILDGLEANKRIKNLQEEKRALRKLLEDHGIEVEE